MRVLSMSGVKLDSLVKMIERRYGNMGEECERQVWQFEDRCFMVLIVNTPVEGYTSLHLYGFVFIIEYNMNGDCEVRIELVGGDAMNLRVGGQSKYENQVADFLVDFSKGKGWRIHTR
jgi:hypothetical protein